MLLRTTIHNGNVRVSVTAAGSLLARRGGTLMQPSAGLVQLVRAQLALGAEGRG